ncbi:MAG TPA: V-type ATPase subunit [Candidatus Limnocylindrales bacterium]|nr:V-type ATPase subunit [Candidatus Limnocylindrales bacterium]
MYDYGNARVAAARSRLLGPEDLVRLRDAGTPAGLLALLERFDDWRRVLGEAASSAASPAEALETAIEQYRGMRLAALLGWYAPPALGLVEALVIPLDVERLVAVVRRRRAGEPSDRIAATVPPGALLDGQAIAWLVRAPLMRNVIERAAAASLIRADDVPALTRLATDEAKPERVERAIVEASDRARLARAAGRGPNVRAVREVIEAEMATRATAAWTTREDGAGIAAPGERDATLARLDRLARLGRRDPLGVAAVAGYVAAVEALSIRLRAALAGAAAGWSPDLVGEYFHLGAGRQPVRGAA